MSNIIRTPITGLLQQDSREESQSITEVIDEIQSARELGVPASELYQLEDAYIRRFPSLYALKYKPIKSKPLTFVSKRSALKNRPWQKAIIDDQHPNKIVEKSRQLGLSELSVTEVVWFLDTHPNTKAMYTFPRAAQMNDFSNTRVAPVFRESKYLNTLLSKEVNNVSTKKIGSSYLFMRSSWDSAIGEGVDADSA